MNGTSLASAITSTWAFPSTTSNKRSFYWSGRCSGRLKHLPNSEVYPSSRSVASAASWVKCRPPSSFLIWFRSPVAAMITPTWKSDCLEVILATIDIFANLHEGTAEVFPALVSPHFRMHFKKFVGFFLRYVWINVGNSTKCTGDSGVLAKLHVAAITTNKLSSTRALEMDFHHKLPKRMELCAVRILCII